MQTCKRTTLKSEKGTLCSEITKIFITIRDSQISGTAKDSQERVYEISGYVDSSGQITGGLGIGGNTVVGITGYLSENSGGGTYKTINGCAGTWSANSFSIYVSRSSTGQNYLYKGPILNTGSIALPDCKPAKGVTKIKSTTWLHPELVEGEKFLLETTAIVNWETTNEADILN